MDKETQSDMPRHACQSVVPHIEEAAEIPQGHDETVLVVEDTHETRMAIKMILEALGYRVLTAGTPGKAVGLADEHEGEIQLLITDIIMPEMNGQDLAKWMLNLYPDMKILFMSGYSLNEIAHLGVLDKEVNFIRKPFSIQDLAVKVRKTLEAV